MEKVHVRIDTQSELGLFSSVIDFVVSFSLCTYNILVTRSTPILILDL